MLNNEKTAYDDYKFRSLTGESTDFKGYFITSERFYHLPSIHQYGHDRKPEFCGEIQNIHTLFRKNSIFCEAILPAPSFLSPATIYISFT